MIDRDKIKQLATSLRKEIIESSKATGKIGIHIGPALSMTDFLAVLYGGYANVFPSNCQTENRDRIILSKGHAYGAFYSVLSLSGFFSQKEFRENYMTDGGLYPAHPIKQLEKGIECSSGSLGMGLAFGIGKAISAKKKGLSYLTYVAMGDGECNEGSTYEAFVSAAQFKLDNLIVFIDNNGMQQDGSTSDIMNIHFARYLSSLGWNVIEVDGNNIDELCDALDNRPLKSGKPFAIIGHTIKGKGVSFMESNNSWHHAVLDDEHYQLAMEEFNHGL